MGGNDRKIKAEITAFKATKGRESLMFRCRDGVVSNAPVEWRRFVGQRPVAALAELKRQGYRVFLQWTM